MRALAGLSRRRFLGLLSTLGGIALLPACGPSQETRELARRMIVPLATPDAWRLVGRSFLEAHPGERGLGRLTSRLVQDLGWDPHTASDDDLAKLVPQRVRGDFHAGRTVMVDGWVLSETEARLAAVAALS